jgi:hypothetical protein
VQRVTVAHLAEREVALLDVRLPGQTIHLVLAGGLGIGIIDAVQRGSLRRALQGATSPSQGRWRSRVQGARLGRVGERSVQLIRDDKAWWAGTERRDLLVLAEGACPDAGTASCDTLEARGTRIVDALVVGSAEARRAALRRALTRSIARIERRADAVRADLARSQSAGEIARRAQLFVVAAARAPRGVIKLTTVDWSSGEAREIELALDPSRGAQEQIEALFKRARRLAEGAKIARRRLGDAEASRAKLVDLVETLAAQDADMDSIAGRAREAAPRDFKWTSTDAPQPRAHSGSQARRHPYRVFRTSSGGRILVGRGAAHNDALTFRIARPHDLWLHAKGRAGAHVLVPLDKGADCPAELLVEAAHLAVHFSDARDETVVEVQHTPRRYLRKPRGSAPGLAVVDREKVIVLRMEPDLLRRLLEREEET